MNGSEWLMTNSGDYHHLSHSKVRGRDTIQLRKYMRKKYSRTLGVCTEPTQSRRCLTAALAQGPGIRLFWTSLTSNIPVLPTFVFVLEVSCLLMDVFLCFLLRHPVCSYPFSSFPINNCNETSFWVLWWSFHCAFTFLVWKSSFKWGRVGTHPVVRGIFSSTFAHYCKKSYTGPFLILLI